MKNQKRREREKKKKYIYIFAFSATAFLRETGGAAAGVHGRTYSAPDIPAELGELSSEGRQHARRQQLEKTTGKTCSLFSPTSLLHTRI